MRRSLALLLPLALFLGSARAIAFGTESEPSYPDLAAATVPAAYMKAITLLPKMLNESTGPGDVKTLRVSLLEARELLDVFSYLYGPVYLAPKLTPAKDEWRASIPDQADLESHGSKDVWRWLRKDLDEGYEVLGDFQVRIGAQERPGRKPCMQARRRRLSNMLAAGTSHQQ